MLRRTFLPNIGIDVEYNSDYYTPHFPHTTKALRMMRSLLVEIMDGDKKENTTSHSNSNDAMSSFVARALRGEQAIPFLVSICRKDAEIAGRGRGEKSQNSTTESKSNQINQDNQDDNQDLHSIQSSQSTHSRMEDLPDQILNLLSILGGLKFRPV